MRFVTRTKNLYDCHAKDLPQLQIGTKVRVQDSKTKRWSAQGIIKDIRDNGRSYQVEVDGKLKLRNRKFLKPVKAQ